MDLTEKKTTTDRLVIAPDRGRLLMSKELMGLVPGLADEETFENDTSVQDETADGLDASPMVILERRRKQQDAEPTEEHVIGRLLRLSVSAAQLVVGMRLDCSEALAVVADVREPGVIYTGIQIHHGLNDVVKVPVRACHELLSAVIDDVTTAGTCTLVATLGHV